MKSFLTTTAAIAFAGTGAVADEIAPEAVAKIETVLAEMQCQMDPDDIELTEDGGYDLDDVICIGGNQFDIELDADFKEIDRRAE